MRSGAHSRALGRLRGEQLEFALDRVDEQIDVTSRAFLGLTVACARCHDQNSDPISQCNYYALAGIFQSTDTLSGGQRAVDGIILNPAVGGADVAQRRRDAKRCGLFHTHPVGECLLVCICFCFAPLRLCATSHRRI